MAQSLALRPAGSRRSLLYLALAVGLVVVVSMAGQRFTTPALPVWYAGLQKPWFTPPNLVFPIAWTLLFALMAYGFWRVLRLDPAAPGRGAAIVAFLAQLAVNCSWSLVFFGMRDPALGLAVVIGFFLLVLATWLLFRRLDWQAGLTFVPYVAWVAYASAINAAIVWLN
jgi:translocator protein